MNIDLFTGQWIGERLMPFDARRLLTDAIAILRRFDPRALIIAGASTLLLAIPLETNPLLALVLGVAVYAGVALLWERAAKEETVVEPPTPEEEAFQRMRASTAQVLVLAEEVENPEVQERVLQIGDTFTVMLDVMEKDKVKNGYASAPEFQEDVVVPFVTMLDYYVRLSQRRIELVEHHLKQFEQTELRRYESLSKSFYQHYHDGDVYDFVALLEMFKSDGDEEDEETFTDDFDPDAGAPIADIDFFAASEAVDDDLEERAS
jgi:hypothetical protein